MSEPNSSPASGVTASREGALRRWRWWLIIGGPVLVVAVVLFVVLTGGRTETTDNAYVQIAKVPVAPSISGRVIDIYVRENQMVKRGQVLFRLDARDSQTTAAAAEAAVANAALQVRALRASYQQEQAMAQAAQDTLAYAIREAARQRDLEAAGVASRQQVDQAAQAVLQARQQLAAARQRSAQVLANLGGDPNLQPAAAPAVMQAQAQLDRARLSLSYSTVVAPSDGVVTRVDQMPLGSYINAAQTAFYLLSGAPWVEANFKEDQLAHMKVGQPVSIKVDAYPDADIKGHVASFSPGTGQAFSALPAQNATGNWVKVVQRLPVRIAFDKPPPEMAARAGLSAKVTVNVRPPGHVG